MTGAGWLTGAAGSGSAIVTGSGSTTGSGSATGLGSTTGSGIRMSAWRTFGISIVSGASTALGGQRHGRDGRLGHGNRCLLCRRCFFGGRNKLRNMRVADRLTLRTPAWERRLSVGHRLSLRGLARTTTKRGIRGGLRASSLLRCRCCGLLRRRDGRGRLRGCWSDGRDRRGDRSLRGIRGRNRGRGALRSVSHWGLEGAAGYASGRHRLTGDRLGRALGEDHRPVVLA